MGDVWIIKNWVTGEDVELPKSDFDEPTQAWVEGWNAVMQGNVENPYIDPPEHGEWDDGFWSALED